MITFFNIFHFFILEEDDGALSYAADHKCNSIVRHLT